MQTCPADLRAIIASLRIKHADSSRHVRDAKIAASNEIAEWRRRNNGMAIPYRWF
jgi:hypothetical protein